MIKFTAPEGRIIRSVTSRVTKKVTDKITDPLDETSRKGYWRLLKLYGKGSRHFLTAASKAFPPIPVNRFIAPYLRFNIPLRPIISITVPILRKAVPVDHLPDLFQCIEPFPILPPIINLRAERGHRISIGKGNRPYVKFIYGNFKKRAVLIPGT